MNTVLKVDKISKILANRKVLNEVSFEVKSWEIYGYLWPNWAWKTTTMKCIMWLIEQEEGNIEILWKKWLTIETKNDIWFMPENTYLYKHLTWYEFLMFNWWFFNFTKSELNKKTLDLLERVWLLDAKDNYLSEYSKGMLQRVWLAQSIINSPKILFLDEPMSWLDPIGRKMVKNLLVELREQWTTIFFNTHILADVESICDRVSIIHKWNIIVEWKKISDINWTLEDFFIEKVEENN